MWEVKSIDVTARIAVKMGELDLSAETVTHELGIDPSTHYRKLASGGLKFTLDRLQRLIEILHLSKEDASSIFLCIDLRKREQGKNNAAAICGGV